ncbi:MULTISPECIES: type II toxin-antitoxin system RelE/ParE family toxin [unclassified Duganella]|uniref:type II toxin-antitoxin system RelE/ParE family toxin n=1 Tax=unclassified Duganella TaxID=2636909 RepID=UPI001E4BBFE1|nr:MULTISPECIES: type II toxin-antitoxin system RelE/ParE family toxin [unclassified Duganella]
MPALIWHPDALADVARLHQFLAQSSPAAARRGAAAIIKTANKIIKHPHLGAPHAEFRNGRPDLASARMYYATSSSTTVMYCLPAFGIVGSNADRSSLQ